MFSVTASKKLPCDLCCIMALECALQIKISVFKLRTLLGEMTPTITVGEVFFVRASKNLPCDFRCIMALECALRIKTSVFKLHTLLGKKTPKKSQRRGKIFRKLIAGPTSMKWNAPFNVQAEDCKRRPYGLTTPDAIR